MQVLKKLSGGAVIEYERILRRNISQKKRNRCFMMKKYWEMEFAIFSENRLRGIEKRKAIA